MPRKAFYFYFRVLFLFCDDFISTLRNSHHCIFIVFHSCTCNEFFAAFTTFLVIFKFVCFKMKWKKNARWMQRGERKRERKRQRHGGEWMSWFVDFLAVCLATLASWQLSLWGWLLVHYEDWISNRNCQWEFFGWKTLVIELGANAKINYLKALEKLISEDLKEIRTFEIYVFAVEFHRNFTTTPVQQVKTFAH